MATKKRKEATDFLLSLGADEEASDVVLARTMSTNLRPPAPPRSLARKQSDNQEAAVDLIEDDTPVNLEPRGGRGSSMIIDGVDYSQPVTPAVRNDIESVDPKRYMPGEFARLNRDADRLENEIKSLEMQLRGEVPVMLRAGSEERRKSDVSRSTIQDLLKTKRNEYKNLMNTVSIFEDQMMGSRPVQRYEEDVRERQATYPGRTAEKGMEKVREAETGEKTLERFYKDDVIGDVGESFLSSPVAKSPRVEVPIAGGGTEVFTRSREMDREDRGNDLGAVQFPNPFEIGGAMLASGKQRILGEDTTAAEVFPYDEAYASQFGGGEMFAPRRSRLTEREIREGRGVLNLPKLETEMTKRRRAITGANRRIQELEQGLQSGGLGGFRGKEYAEIELLKDEVEQMEAELRQMARIRRTTQEEIERQGRSESLSDEFAEQF